MATLPATGSQISFGQVNRVFTGNTPGAAGNAPSGGQNIKLSAVLGNNGIYQVGQAVGTQIRFSATFGGRIGGFS
jgi:hypothetical protein